MLSFDFIKYSKLILKKLEHSKKCLIFLIALRLFNSLFVVTSFFPDEYAQSIEISHYWVFGYGHMPWEWEPCISLRSVIHPFLYAILFYILKITKLDYPIAVLYAPKIFQGLCAALGDYGLMKLIKLWYLVLYKKNNMKSDDNAIFTILICHFFCWFYFYCICRTSSLSFECLFNIWGIYFLSKNYYPLKEKDKNISNNSNYKVKKSLQIVKFFDLREEKIPKNNTNSDLKKRKDITENKDFLISEGRNDTSCDNNTNKIYEESKNKDLPRNEKLSMHNKSSNLSVDIKELNEIKYFHIKNLILSLLFSSFCVLFRPNAALFWLCIYILYFIKSANNKYILDYKEVFFIGTSYAVIFLSISIAIDSYYYGKITVSFINFLLFNFISSQNSFFGKHPFHFYFSSVIPSIYLTLTPFTYYSFIFFYKKLKKKKKKLFYVLSRIDYVTYIATFVEVLFLSFSIHKEHKLVIGYLPFLTILTGLMLHKTIRNIENSEQTDKRKKFFFYLNVSFFIHLICIFFFSYIHNRSPEKVSAYFRNLKTNNDNNISIFITDCYDIPLYSHIHRKFKIGFLDCSPIIKNGMLINNWRKIIYDDKFGKTFYDLFDVNKNTSNSISPYIIPEKSFYWFGYHNFNPKQNFQFSYNIINFSCLDYRYSFPLNGELPLYIVTNSINLPYLTNFLKEFNYHLEGNPFFSYFLINENKKIVVVNHYIFKKYSIS
ncbi:GPI mannosyltransferase 3, putative [Plasmodium gallinaceum]|uniref:Mannosyltransferase n=1 Tax=Plasmodium gallinaceum TaxID=5849 RepID=A0A1J1GRR8_PLAGA|nr:GPI mannosyltransferase 3, putative [Plasmodium gallinaceum]CRG95122.1 GPI mannosyltransferase 3, putative [Plasmodium gallinaceum]